MLVENFASVIAPTTACQLSTLESPMGGNPASHTNHRKLAHCDCIEDMNPASMPINRRQLCILQHIVLKVRLVQGFDVVVIISNAHRTADVSRAVAIANLLSLSEGPP